MQTKIIDYGMNGEGVAKIDNKIYLIDNALLDELVDVEIIKDYGNYATAKVKSIITESKNRTAPPCPYYHICGGCHLQHAKYFEQLKFKTTLVKKTLKKIANIDVEVNHTTECSQQFAYRNKMSFSILNNNCGLLQLRSNEVVDITECKLATENINKILKLFKSYAQNLNARTIKNLVIREIDNQILVGIVSKKEMKLNNFFITLSKQFENIGLYQIINTRKDSVVLDGLIKHVGGIKNIKIHNFDLTYYVDLLGFHQTNIEIQNKIYQKVLDFISPNSIVINGFSGQGLLSAIIAKKAKQVIGIEINKSSHLSAEKLKSDNKITNLKNICGDFHKFIKQELNKADTIILDPTKKGCGKTVMNEIKGVKNIIYISCNPIALAKDLKEIINDYQIEEITPFDMFPNTINVETLVRLKLKENIK